MDFKNCKYRIDRIPLSEDCITHFPDLSEHVKVFGSGKGLGKNVTADLLLRYIIMMFAPGSPCIESMPSINQRKTWVMKELGVKPALNGVFEDGWNDVLINRNEVARKRVVYFLRLQYSEVYANLRVAEMDLYNIFEMESPTSEKETADRVKARTALVDEIEKLKRKIVQNETSVIVANEVSRFVAEENMGIRPEDYMEFSPKSVLPESAKASTMFPDIPS